MPAFKKYRFGVSKFSLRINFFLQDIFSMIPFIQQDLCCDLKALKRVQIELSKDYLKQDDWYPRRNKFGDYFARQGHHRKRSIGRQRWRPKKSDSQRCKWGTLRHHCWRWWWVFKEILPMIKKMMELNWSLFFVGLSDDECVHEFFWVKLWLLAKVLGETHVIELIRTKDILELLEVNKYLRDCREKVKIHHLCFILFL